VDSLPDSAEGEINPRRGVLGVDSKSSSSAVASGHTVEELLTPGEESLRGRALK
jgi:hypothetical protein